MNRPLHVSAVYRLTFMAVGPSRTCLWQPCARRVRTGPAISLPILGPERCLPPAGVTRRPHQDARNHHEDGARRGADSRRLGPIDHTRFRVSLGLHRLRALGGTNTLFAPDERLGNTYAPATHDGWHPAGREREPGGQAAGNTA